MPVMYFACRRAQSTWNDAQLYNMISKEHKYAIVIGRFNEFIGSKLLSGSIDTLKRHGVGEDEIDIIWVPGAFEIPLVAKKLTKSLKYNAIMFCLSYRLIVQYNKINSCCS